jgi:hypothetical protein
MADAPPFERAQSELDSRSVDRAQSENAAPGSLRRQMSEKLKVSFASGSSSSPCLSQSAPASPSIHSPAHHKLQSAIRVTYAATHLVHRARYTMPFGDLAMTTLMHACATGSLEKVRSILDHLRSDASVLALELAAGDDWAGSTPLHWAAYSGNTHVVQALLDAGCPCRQAQLARRVAGSAPRRAIRQDGRARRARRRREWADARLRTQPDGQHAAP